MNHSFKTFAGLLLGAVAIVGCQREPVATSPSDNSEKQEVVVDLVLNVSTGQNSPTKMSDANAQVANNFLGIQDAVIIPFETGNTETDRYVTLNAGHTTGNQFYDLGLLFPTSQIPEGDSKEKSRRVVQLSIPLGTDAMLFYGKAYNPTPSGSTEEERINNLILNRRNRGALLNNISTTPTDPTDIEFNLVSRLTGEKAYIPVNESDINLDSYTQTAELMEYILNLIIYDAAVPAIASYKAPKDVVTYTELPALTWRDLASKQVLHEQLKPLEDMMASAYNKIMTVNNNEYRGASSYAVSLIMEDLSEIIDAVVNAVPTCKEEANVIRLSALNIKPNIDKFFDHDNSHVFQQLSLLQGYVTESLTPTDTQTKEQIFEELFGKAKEPADFPYTLFHIPEGAAQMGIDSNGKIEYKIPNRALLHPGSSEVTAFPPYKYTFPAELAYYVNSPLLVTTSNVEDSDTYFPNGYKNWYNEKSWGDLNLGWGQGFVGTETKGVAIRDNVNYGVALLETNVAYAPNITTVQDNRGHFSEAEGNASISINDLSLELYGVLIGNQNVKVNWQYINTTNDVSDYSFVLYDDVMETTRGSDTSASFVKPGSTVTNYTLVLDNYINQPEQLEVPIALEFINRGVDFWGRDNLIRKDATFYLLGKLKIADAVRAIDWNITENKMHENPAYIERYGYQVPPTYGVESESAGSNGKGKSKKITRVFIQNFTTKANFKIGTETLKHAYVTLPDLRSSQMSLGLSVDLSWESGLEFTVEL
ncbi:MAG: hypothetical protein SPK87_02640 [Bacteroidales bacterium]|nr:hypothetical protein [Bacteroidales bacterium]